MARPAHPLAKFLPFRGYRSVCRCLDPGRVSREQGHRAWAAALAAELPPLTNSQAAAVPRIAARLDARNVQEPAA
jgi:hypothetical protein